MKSLFFTFFLLFSTFFVAQAQYHLTFKMTYYEADGSPTPLVEGQMPAYQDYYIMEGRSKSIFDCGHEWMDLYNADSNERALITSDGEINKFSGTENEQELLKMEALDTTLTVMGYACKAMKMTYENFDITIFYSEELRVDPKPFSQNKYAGFDQVMEATNGGLDLKYIYDFKNKSQLVATPIVVEKVALSADDFKPKLALKKFREANTKALENLQQNIADKYALKKNTPNNVEVIGQVNQGKITFPLDMKIQNPDQMLMTMSFSGADFYVGVNHDQSWQYNPVEDQVDVQDIDEKDFNEDFLGEFCPLLKANWDQYEILSFLTLDSAYRVLVKRKQDEKIEVYYFDKGTYFVGRWGGPESYYDLEDYKIFDGLPFPGIYAQGKYGEEQTVFKGIFKEVNFNVDLAKDAFEIPEALQSKVVEKEEQTGKTYEEYYQEAEALINDEKYKEAIPLYKKAIALNGSIPMYHNQLGMSMLNTGDNYGAVAEFSKALDLNPNFDTALHNLGYAKMQFGDYEAAINDISEAIVLNPRKPVYYANRGHGYYALEKFDSALVDYKKVVALDAKDKFGNWNVAMCFYRLEQYDSAILYFDRSEANDYVNGELHNYRGICYYKLEEYEKALDDFKEATKSDNPLINYFGNLGNTYSELGNAKKAIQAFKAGTKMDSTYAEGHNLMGLEFLSEGTYDAAINAFTEAIAINHTEPVYFDNRGKAKSAQMDYLGAIEDYSQSISLYPDDPNIYYLRGMAKRNVNEKFDACRDLKKASELGLKEAEELMDEYCVSGGGD